MEVSASSRSRFRFRDHPQMDSAEATDGNTNSDSSSLSSDADDETELESMTGKGIMHLCSELFELKRVSDEDFHKNIFSNYSAFLSIFREVEGLENELVQLKNHVLTQKRLVENLSSVYIQALSHETIEYSFEDCICLEPSPQSILKARADNVSDVLDVLLSEQRLDEALEVLESESGNFDDLHFQENFPFDEFTCFKSVLLERRAMIVDQLKMVATSPRVSPAELLKALVRLRRVGESHLATHLLLQYYHSRIVSGIHELQYLKSTNGAYIHDAAKFAFSSILKAAKTFLVLNGEKCSNFSDLMQWAYEETELFAACFNKYIQSISDITDGMVTVLEALQPAMSYCSLLETNGIVLNPCLVKHIRPCVEEFLQIHIDHFKKVICIFTSADAWLVGQYLLSGILCKECSSMDSAQQPEYFLLTNSGRKLVTVLQAITNYVFPLVVIQLEGPILKGLMDLYTEYISILESALTGKSNGLDKVGPGINLAESPEQQVSILANIFSIVQLLSSVIRNVFKDISHLTFEVHSFILYIQEASEKLRGLFCHQFISRVLDENGVRLTPETWVGGQRGSDTLDDVMPSVVFQGLFFELRKLEKLAEENFVELDWLLELMKELMVSIFISISNNEELWTNTAEVLAVKHSGNPNQFVLDMQFLVEIARHGGYFCNNIMCASLTVLSQMQAAFISVGLDSKSATIEDGWAINAAKEALQKLQALQAIREESSPPNETVDGIEQGKEAADSAYASGSYENDETPSLSKSLIIDVPAALFISDTETPKLDVISPQGIVYLERVNSIDSISNLENTEDGSAADAMTNTGEGVENIKSLQEQLNVNDDGEIYGAWSEEDETRSHHEALEQEIREV